MPSSIMNLGKPSSIPPLVIDYGFQGIVNVDNTFISIYLVDKVGRRKLLLQACCQMLVSQFAIGAILATNLSETGMLNKTLTSVVVFPVCTYVMLFAWSWGPLGLLIPSETFLLETRTTDFAFKVGTNKIFTSLIAQVFLDYTLHNASLHFLFSGWIIVMGLFVNFLLPETKGVPIDSMVERVWMHHPIWKRLF